MPKICFIVAPIKIILFCVKFLFCIGEINVSIVGVENL